MVDKHYRTKNVTHYRFKEIIDYCGMMHPAIREKKVCMKDAINGYVFSMLKWDPIMHKILHDEFDVKVKPKKKDE